MTGGVTLTGSLNLAELADTDPTAALAAAVASYLRGDVDIATVLTAFRAATVLVEVSTDNGAHQITAVRREGLCWVPVCTGLPEFARWMQAAGRGADTVQWGQITGAELLDDALRALPRGTGMILNPGSERVLALPPVASIVAPALAVDTEET